MVQRRCHNLLRAATLCAAIGIAAPVRGARADGAPAPPPNPATPTPAGTALDVFFHGTVLALDGAKVRLRYDFSSAEQKKDWVDGFPWRVATDANDATVFADGHLALRGTAGARLVAEWDEVSLSCRFVPDGVKDIGGYLSTPDSGDDYVSFTIGETYFHNWDKKTGGETGMMKFEKAFSAVKGGGFVGFRYLGSRMPVNPPSAGKACAVAFGRRAEKFWMTVDDLKLESQEPPPRIKTLRIGLYSIHSSVTVDDVVIEGTLSSRWLTENKVALKLEKPLGTDVAVVGADPAVAALVADYAAGKASVTKLVDLLGDPTRSEADRQALAGAVKAGPKKGVRGVVDLLYNADVKVRTVGIEIVKAMLGKNYGYDPKAGEKARGAAAARLAKDLDEHPELTRDGGN